MEHISNKKVQQPCCTVTIEYNNSIRSIDLENLLSGMRMICQYELANKTRLKSRDFTDVTHIQKIEKGSIILTMFFDFVHIHVNPLIDINIDLCNIDIDIVDIILLYLGKDKIPNKLKGYVQNIKSALTHITSLKLENSHNDSTVTIDNNGRVEISNNK